MPQDASSPKTSGLVDIVHGILDDLRVLLRQEVQLFQDEMKLELSKAGRAASGLGIGIGLVAIGGFFLLLMLVYALHELLGLPLWASYAVLGLVLAGSGGFFLLRARSLAAQVNAMPRRTLHTVKEDAQWIKAQVFSKRS
jgi:hypothetical protein